MSTLEKMRSVADLLLYQKKYKEAYIIYDELYRQMWTVLGSVNNSNYLSFKSIIKIVKRSNGSDYNNEIDTFLNSICKRYYNIDLSIFISEFIKTLYGHLQCICFTSELIKEILIDNVLTEFLILYILIIQPDNQKKISPIFNIANSVLDDNKLKRVKALLPRKTTEKLLMENVQNNQTNELKMLNQLLLRYLSQVYSSKNPFYSTINSIVNSHHYENINFNYSNFNNYNFYTSYERYERYERFENYGYQKVNNHYEFNPTLASDDEKKIYYGKLIGLKGKVSKSQIRTKYLELISQYHPDKVQHLGPELRELAERKTKEINIAYNWLKNRYNF